MVALEAVEGGHRRRRGQLRAPPFRTSPRWTTWSRPPATPPATPDRRATSRRCPSPDVDDPALGRRARRDVHRGVRPAGRRPRRGPSTARSATTASPRHDAHAPSGSAPPPGVRRRWVQPTGSIELNVKTPELDGSAWTGAVDRRLHRRRRRRAGGGRHRPAGLGARRVSAAGRSLRDAAAAVGGVGLPAACSRGRWAAGRPRRGAAPSPVRTGRASASGSRTGSADAGVSDPAAPGLEYAPFVTALHSGDGVSVFDNGAPARRVEWLRDGAVHELAYSGPRRPSSARGSRRRATTCCSPVARTAGARGPGRRHASAACC